MRTNETREWMQRQELFSPERLITLSQQQLVETIFDIGQGESIELWMRKEQNYQKELKPEVQFCSKEKRFINSNYLKKCTKKEFDIRKKEIWTCFQRGFAVIIDKGCLKTEEDYEIFDRRLFQAMGMNAYFEWIHEYLYWIAPDQFSIWHSQEWQRHILFAHGIHPSCFFYGRSGQICLLARKMRTTMEQFAVHCYNKFGEVRQFFRIGTSDQGEDYFLEWKENHIAAIGWSDLGPLEQYAESEQLNKRELKGKLEQLYYPGVKQLASRKARELINFYQASNHCIFVAMRGEQLLALGDQVGAYYYNQSVKFSHRKPIQWHCCFQDGEKLPNKSEGLRTSFYELKDEENLLYLYQKYYKEVDQTEKIDCLEKESNTSFEFKQMTKREKRKDPICPLNQILYGPPGTGKTYATVEYALAIIQNRQVDHSIQTEEQREQKMRQYHERVQAGQIVFTTFHQSYGYDEFVQGIRPDIHRETIQFQKKDGVFKVISDRALEHPEQKYVLIIDEINRGNISKIFGELITLIEEDKRLGELNELTITLPSGDRFAVPNNLYIIGTMNSADQSISIMDTALRRRFQFIEMLPQAEKIQNKTLRHVFQTLNQYLKKQLRISDLLIGHSFFMNRTEDDLGAIFNQMIIPLLYEYFYREEDKIREALQCLKQTNFSIDENYTGRIHIKRNEQNSKK